MGGETIVDIISRAPWTKENCTLVLQPMTRSAILREYLYSEGFEITDEEIVTESGHMYCIIVAKYSGSVEYEPYEKYVSRAALKSELSGEYIKSITTRLLREYKSRKNAGVLTEEEKKLREDDLISLEEMRKRYAKGN